MAESHKPFRYLIPAGSNFDFLRWSRPISTISLLLIAASIAILFVNKAVRGEYMNWTIDFKGGTEVVLEFKDKASGQPIRVSPADARSALKDTRESNSEVTEISWTDEKDVEHHGLVVRTPVFGAVEPDQAKQVVDAINAKYGETVVGVRWSGDDLRIKAKQVIAPEEIAEIFTAAHLELKPLSAEALKENATIDKATEEYELNFSAEGIGREIERGFENALADMNLDGTVINSYSVGARAGEQLFFDGVRALLYAMALIMLYLVFRFDIRYAPGAIKATLHDGVLAIGILAATWTPVSLTTLAALLTVVGYSVNDTAIVFDRIRENMAKHKDKKVERVVNISLNEVLGRSILTSLFVFSVTLMMNIFGDGLIRNFAFVLNVGVVIGAASTIFLSAPVFVWIHKRWYSGPPTRRRPDNAETP
jgi:preprotein translocase subunit SecF